MKVDLDAIQSSIVGSLPVRARWAVKGTWLDFDFSAARHGLRPLARDSFTFEVTETDWFDLLIFGEYDYAEGGGANPFLGIRSSDAAVCGLDVERDREATFLLNFSIEQFIQTFAYLNEYLGNGRPLPSGADLELHAIDPVAYPKSDWKGLVSYVAEPD